MSSPAESLARSGRREDAWGSLDRFLRARLCQRLDALRGGQLRLQDALGDVLLGEAPANQSGEALCPTLRVHDPVFYRMLAGSGSVGAGEAYMDGAWSCDDLVALVRLLVRNRELLDGVESGPAKLAGLAMRWLHAARRNTRSGSRRNIAAHYDLGNEFFRLFLDADLMYSSAMYASAGESLEVASKRKLQRICDKLDLRAQDHLLEIGTGWGGMAIFAAREYGCRVTTTTISERQHALASERVRAAGLQDRITLLLRDYRDLEGSYDKLVSIEMVEAVGHQYLDGYFSKCASLLAPDGLALVQAITIEDHRYRQALDSVDFIKRHVFPGSFIPCVSVLAESAARAGKLRLLSLEDFCESYAWTLREWRKRFMAKLDAARALGLDERFLRMWEFYLAYCEGGFIERAISDVQMLLAPSGNRRPQYLPGL
ncbi:MAG: cyclopropane-fatty-acyl-phospholipid synthase family protein [Arenimonas sp.]